jgi:hypothetical protein
VDEPRKTRRIDPRWAGGSCIVAAPGPSLTPEVIHKVRFARWLNDWRVIVVNDAYKALPHADVLYAVDNGWWQIHGQCQGFTGEKWAAHEQDPNPREIHGNDKRELAQRFGINLVRGLDGDEFSFDPAVIRYGQNSGFQAINLALLFGATRIVLVGFDMRHVGGKSHYFGDHPRELRTASDDVYRKFAPRFARAAAALPKTVSIVNATPESALTCFKMESLDDALREVPRENDRVPCDGAELRQASG